jgi:hypothetical protein
MHKLESALVTLAYQRRSDKRLARTLRLIAYASSQYAEPAGDHYGVKDWLSQFIHTRETE